jgi:hypothetical protein
MRRLFTSLLEAEACADLAAGRRFREGQDAGSTGLVPFSVLVSFCTSQFHTYGASGGQVMSNNSRAASGMSRVSSVTRGAQSGIPAQTALWACAGASPGGVRKTASARATQPRPGRL